MENHSENTKQETCSKLSKRLAYLLRYGAEKEGIKVSEEGYMKLTDLLKVPLMRFHNPQEILDEVEKSVTTVGHKRFEVKDEHGSTYIRALYGRRMERNPCHEGTKVLRLMECCVVHICNNIKDYDLQYFPDEFLIHTIMHRLKTTHRLTNKAFDSLLGPGLETLDLGGAMVTAGTIKLVGQRCSGLKHLNLRESSYVLNDHIMEILLKKLPKLESLNLAGCSHLSDRTLNAIIKNCQNISKINLTFISNISQGTIIKAVTKCTQLKHLDIFDNKNITEDGMKQLAKLCNDSGIVVILKGLELDISSNDSLTLKLASVGRHW